MQVQQNTPSEVIEGTPAKKEIRGEASARTWKAQFYPEVCVGGFTDIDGTILFYNRVLSLLEPHSVVVDFGCGRGAFFSDPVRFRREMRMLRNHSAMAIGLDIDSASQSNPGIHQFRLLESSRWPVDDGAADLVLLDCVVEHLPDPGAVFREAARVLRRGGYIAIRTTNRWHYVGFIARVLPSRFHKRTLRAAQPSRQEKDIFPASYRCNDLPEMRRQLRAAGFEPFVYAHEPEPGYLAFSRWAYALGVVYQRIVPKFFRSTILAFGRRQ